MIIKNYLEGSGEKKRMHGGSGVVESIPLFQTEDFETNLRYIAFVRLPRDSSIGDHKHNNEREEIYVVLNGSGILTINGEARRVRKGDVILTKIGWTHGIKNDTDEPLEVFVFWVQKG